MFGKSTILPALLLAPFFLFSQSNFKKGYFINNANDTISGFINYKDFPLHPRSITFSDVLTSPKSQVYPISEVRAFCIEGYESFERHFVSMTMTKMSLDGLSELDYGTESDTVFLKVVIKGNHLDMFSYTDKVKTRYYIKEADQSSPVELLYKQDKERTYPIFQRQLTTIAIKHQKLSDKLNLNIQQALYSRPAISKIVSDINDRSEKNFSLAKNKKQKLRILVGTGVNHNSLTYGGRNIITYESNSPPGPIIFRDKVSYTSYSPSFSIGFDLLTNADIQRLVIRNELSTYFLKSNTRTVFQYYYPEENVAYEYRLSAIAISYSPQLIYNVYNGKDLKWNAGTGVTFNFWNYPENEYHQQPLSQSSTYSDMIINNYMELNKRSVGAVVRSGVILYNKVDIGFKAFINPTYLNSKEPEKPMMLKFVNLGINYLLAKKNQGK
jgi:hypothetical protein